jgi:hypothetical protein
MAVLDKKLLLSDIESLLNAYIPADIKTTMTYVHVNERNTENAYRKYACM